MPAPNRGRGEDAQPPPSWSSPAPARRSTSSTSSTTTTSPTRCASSRRAPTSSASTRPTAASGAVADRRGDRALPARNRDKPIILALSRPDRRKNIITLSSLRQLARAAGAREPGARGRQPRRHPRHGRRRRREVLTDLLLARRPRRPLRQSRLPQAARARPTFRCSTGWPPQAGRLRQSGADRALRADAHRGGGQRPAHRRHRGRRTRGHHRQLPATAMLIDPLDREAIAAALLDIAERPRRLARAGAQRAWPASTSTIPGPPTPKQYLAALKPLLERTEPLPRRPRPRAPASSIATGRSSPTWTRTCSATRSRWPSCRRHPARTASARPSASPPAGAWTRRCGSCASTASRGRTC